jgi:hypothetical protein
MKALIALLLLAALAGCSSTGGATNPESSQAQCTGTWDARAQVCIGK